MIIICPCGEKKFEVDEKLIPEKGRTLQCGSCEKKWFFEKNVKQEISNETLQLDDVSSESNNEIMINEESDFTEKKTINHIKNEEKNHSFNFGLIKIFNYLIVLIISVIALIILLDTFKDNLSFIFPNLELFLYNLFESVVDIKLFINDLIR